MNYTIFIGDDCHECDEVVEYMKDNQPEVPIYNLDHDDKEPPIKVYVRPTLFNGSELVCYGSDIIRYFEQKKDTGN